MVDHPNNNYAQITFNSPTLRDSYNNYLSHQFEVSISDFITGEGTIECINCGIEHKGDPREFEWLIYLPCGKS
jgi:hypothetical protein